MPQENIYYHFKMATDRFTINDLYDFIKESFGIKVIPDTIKKQINKYSLQLGMKAIEIARCISYYQDTKNGELDPLYGIWFVPNVKEAAEKYFHKLKLEQESKIAEAKRVVEYENNNIIFNIKSLKHKKRQPIQLDITNVDIEGGSND